jgi:hypothetical protein
MHFWIRICIVVSLFHFPTFMAMATEDNPPVPQGPPTASAAAGGGFSMLFIREILRASGETTLADHNEHSPHKLSWAPGANPLLCSNCISSPFLSATTNLDRPNNVVARVDARLEFDLDVDNNPFSRRVITPVEFIASCSGWQHGDGIAKIIARVGKPYIEGGSILESIIDFFSPWGLSAFIDNKIAAKLPGGSQSSIERGACTSLGVYTDNGSIIESFTWDEPALQSILDSFQIEATGQTEKVVLTLHSIRRKPSLSLQDDADPVNFVFFVNGKFIDVPMVAQLIFPIGSEVSLGDFRVTFPKENLRSLQLIVSYDLGGVGWVQHNESEGFALGHQLLVPHRHEYHSSPSGFPKPLKPTVTNIKEFEIDYSVTVWRPGLAKVAK